MKVRKKFYGYIIYFLDLFPSKTINPKVTVFCVFWVQNAKELQGLNADNFEIQDS